MFLFLIFLLALELKQDPSERSSRLHSSDRPRAPPCPWHRDPEWHLHHGRDNAGTVWSTRLPRHHSTALQSDSVLFFTPTRRTISYKAVSTPFHSSEIPLLLTKAISHLHFLLALLNYVFTFAVIPQSRVNLANALPKSI